MHRGNEMAVYEGLRPAERAVLHLLHEALYQLRKMTLSDEEARWLATEFDPADVRHALERLCQPHPSRPGPLAVRVANNAGLRIYRITSLGREVIVAAKAVHEARSNPPGMR